MSRIAAAVTSWVRHSRVDSTKSSTCRRCPGWISKPQCAANCMCLKIRDSWLLSPQGQYQHWKLTQLRSDNVHINARFYGYKIKSHNCLSIFTRQGLQYSERMTDSQSCRYVLKEAGHHATRVFGCTQQLLDYEGNLRASLPESSACE